MFSLSCMKNVQWRVSFGGQQCTISIAVSRTLVRVTLVHSSERVDESWML